MRQLGEGVEKLNHEKVAHIKYKTMKTLATTFALATAIIIGAIAYSNSNSNASEMEVYNNGRTIVSHDALGRIVSELDVVADGKEWNETTLRQTTYEDNTAETVTYIKENGMWVAKTRQISEMSNGTISNVIRYDMSIDGRWVVKGEMPTNDLSQESSIVDDMMFDAQGNLVMKATYQYDNDGKHGLEKDEYVYVNGERKRTVSYTWNDNAWQKTSVNNIVSKIN